MFEIQGKYATAKVFAGILEKTAVDQINTLLNQPFMEDTQPRFMLMLMPEKVVSLVHDAYSG